MFEIKNFINNKFHDSNSGEFLDCINPASEEIFGKVVNSNESDVKQAIEAANLAFPAWSALEQKERSSYLIKLSDLILENLEELAMAESMDNGKPLSLARSVDIPRAASNFSFFAHYVEEFKDQLFEDDQLENYVFHKPLGVVACISPWNLPLYLFTWKVAPALIMGNTVVAKPSEVTPITAFLLSNLVVQAGLPPGVLNIIHGQGSRVGETLCTHPKVKAISFTGSTATGRIINQLAAPYFKKVSLEMGGKNATIVFDDCEFEKTLEQVILSAFSNQGQICLCGSRLYVHSDIYEKFKSALIEKVSELKVGDPMDDYTQQGALVSKEHFEKVLGYLDLARSEGGKILTGGESLKVEGKGYFIRPTVIEGLKGDSRCIQEEIFGPVLSLNSFNNEQEAIDLANSTDYGLAGSIFSLDLEKAKRVADAVHTGMLWINTWMKRDLRIPFGGVKSSGLGREGGKYALSFFSETKTITRLK